MQKISEIIAHEVWQKLIRQNWSNVSGEIQLGIEEYDKLASEGWKAKISELDGYLIDRHQRVGDLEMKVQQLEAVIRERSNRYDKIQNLLRETATRAQLIFPTDSESIEWFNDGTDHKKSDFFIRLYEHFEITAQCDKCGRALQGGLFCPECDLK